MTTIDTSILYLISPFTVLGFMVAGYQISQVVWKIGEYFSAKRKLVQTQKELAEMQLRSAKGRGM
jgi:hypothetical protein